LRRPLSFFCWYYQPYCRRANTPPLVVLSIFLHSADFCLSTSRVILFIECITPIHFFLPLMLCLLLSASCSLLLITCPTPLTSNPVCQRPTCYPQASARHRATLLPRFRSQIGVHGVRIMHSAAMTSILDYSTQTTLVSPPFLSISIACAIRISMGMQS